MADRKCRSCGGASIVEDEGQVVCTACGQVQEEVTSFQLDRGLEEFGQACHSGSSYNSTFASKDYRLRNSYQSNSSILNKWTKIIRQLCERMQITSREMQKEATTLFERAFKCGRFKSLRVDKKLAMCASCVYLICRQHNWPILIGDLAQFTDTPCDILKRLNMDIIQELHIQIDTLGIEDYLPTCLHNFGVKDETLTKKTLEIISLAVDVWLDSGRHLAPLVLAACCIAWQASTHLNHKKSCKEFERTVLNQKVPLFTMYRLAELRDVLQLMATRVPWISKSVLAKKNSWMFYLDDILRYKRSLLSRLEPPEDITQDDGEEEPDVIVCEEPEKTFVIAPPSFKASERKRALEGDRTDETAHKIAKSGHLTAESMDSPILSEKDIPDSELVNYIKTPKEVEVAKQLADIVDL